MGLKVWLPLNGNVNNLGLDGNTMTGSPASWGTGKIGKCATFNGNISNVIYNNTTEYNYTDNFSFCIWVKHNFTSGSAQYAFTVGRADATGYGYAVQPINTSTIVCRFGSSYIEVACPANEWHHIAMTVSGTVIKIYKDGILYKTVTTGTLPTYANGNGLGLGCFHYTSNIYPYYGSLNDFRIYDHCLSAKEIKEISKGLVLHYKLAGVGNPNMIQNSMINLTSSSYGFASRYVGVLEDNTTYTFTVNGRTNADKTSDDGKYLMVYIYPTDWAWSKTIAIKETVDITKSITFTTPTGTSSKTFYFNAYYYPSEGNSGVVPAGTCTINWCKLEKDDKSTPWCPKSTDTLYSSMGFNDNKEYDCSGYGNHGTKSGAISWSGDSPKYTGSYDFPTGSYINAGQGAKITDEITVNIWAYMSTWAIDPHMLSCTESGGWNFENNSQYISFPLYVSGVGYVTAKSTKLWTSLSSGWHMFTGTYDGINVKLYIDGVLSASTSNGKTTKTAIGYNSTNSIFLHAEAGSDPTTPYDATSYKACKMSDCRIYATALSATDILSLYNTKFSVDNQGNFYCGDIVTLDKNILFDVETALLNKTFSNGLSSYTQTNCKVTLTNDGYRIYRAPNLTTSADGNTMWGGLRLQNQGWLEKGHTYIILFNVKGQTSNAVTSIGWTNQMGWSGGGLDPKPSNVSYSMVGSNFNGEKLCYYKFTVNDDIYKVCTSSYSSFVAGTTYLSYNHFMFGFGYSSTGTLGTDLYLTNFRMYDITNLKNGKFNKTSVLECISIIEGNSNFSIGKCGEIRMDDIIEY